MQNPTAFEAAIRQQALKTPQFPEQEQLRCPRCDSTNTKFCYYNNYNLSQPRYFCKSCRRYWTKGGALRNIPVGGSSRKSSNKRSASSFTSSSTDCPGPKRPSSAVPTTAVPTPGPSGRLPVPKPEPGPMALNSASMELGLELPAGSFSSLLAASDGQVELGSLLEGIGPGPFSGPVEWE